MGMVNYNSLGEKTTDTNGVGTFKQFAGSIDVGYLNCDGDAYSRVTYANLYDIITEVKGIVTISEATPGVVTLTDHGLATGSRIEITTTGALPTGLVEYTNYFVINIDANTFNLATSRANAIATTGIDTTSAGSGIHTLRSIPWGTTSSSLFSIPDMRAAALYGSGTSTTFTENETIALADSDDDQIQGHNHNIYNGDGTGSGRQWINATLTGNTSDIPNLSAPLVYRAADEKANATDGTPRT